ncbi:MAG: hypothetical protein AB9835_11310 [Eubacteriales bacterium]
MEDSILTYKGKPLVRQGNILCYGNAEDKYILVLTILDSKEHKGMDVATKVLVQLQSTDQNASMRDKVVKTAEKDSLFDALDIGCYGLKDC